MPVKVCVCVCVCVCVGVGMCESVGSQSNKLCRHSLYGLHTGGSGVTSGTGNPDRPIAASHHLPSPWVGSLSLALSHSLACGPQQPSWVRTRTHGSGPLQLRRIEPAISSTLTWPKAGKGPHRDHGHVLHVRRQPSSDGLSRKTLERMRSTFTKAKTDREGNESSVGENVVMVVVVVVVVVVFEARYTSTFADPRGRDCVVAEPCVQPRSALENHPMCS